MDIRQRLAASLAWGESMNSSPTPDPAAPPPDIHPRRRATDSEEEEKVTDWFKAPRWFLMFVISALMFIAGDWWSEKKANGDAETQRLKAAIETPTVYQLRLGDRVTKVETKMEMIEFWMRDMVADVKDIRKEVKETNKRLDSQK